VAQIVRSALKAQMVRSALKAQMVHGALKRGRMRPRVPTCTVLGFR